MKQTSPHCGFKVDRSRDRSLARNIKRGRCWHSSRGFNATTDTGSAYASENVPLSVEFVQVAAAAQMTSYRWLAGRLCRRRRRDDNRGGGGNIAASSSYGQLGTCSDCPKTVNKGDCFTAPLIYCRMHRRAGKADLYAARSGQTKIRRPDPRLCSRDQA